MRRAWMAAAASVAVFALTASAAPPPGRPGGEGASGEAAPAGVLRQRLQRRLDETRRKQARLERALAALDEGRSPREAMAELRPDAAGMEHRRPARPGPDEGAPPVEVSAEPPTPEEIRAFIEEHLPKLSGDLKSVEAVAPGGTKRIVDALAPRIGEVIAAQRRDERLGELKLDELKIGARVIDASRDARELAGGEGGLTEAEENALRTSLVELLSIQARVRDDVRLREIELLEARTESMRAEVLTGIEGRESEIARLADRMIQRIKSPSGRWRERWQDRRDRRPGSDRAAED